jgi:UDP-N-acetyl-D-glucosamine dehydrogenase
VRALNDVGKPVNGTKIALLGVSYKAGVGDMRESPALKIGALLQGLGADLVYHDDYVPEVAELGLRSTALDAAVDGADAVVIVTAHPGIDFDALASQALVIDFRGVTRGGDAPAIRL